MLPTVLISIVLIVIIVNLLLTIRNKSDDRDNELRAKLLGMDSMIARLEPLIREELSRSREETQRTNREHREEQFTSLITLSDRLTQELKAIRSEVESKLNEIRESNLHKLEEMRATVDEKLQSGLEKRFNESFKLISDRLELVHRGLGEMQNLAIGVGDLKKVLTNVKTRGNFGEIQLGSILSDMLSPDQYESNSVVRSGSLERVEFAIRLPGQDQNRPILLPIDSKFPNEDYQRLLDAYDSTSDTQQKDVEVASKQFEASIKKNAKDIRDKYINPPATTDFAIMFVPTEGLYAEVLRRTGLFETLQRDFRVTVVGPTNLVAFLNSLQMGFRTLAIERRSSEVWELLGVVKSEFSRFGTLLEKTKKKLQEAANVIDSAEVRSRVIERRLRDVQELPADSNSELLPEGD